MGIAALASLPKEDTPHSGAFAESDAPVTAEAGKGASAASAPATGPKIPAPGGLRGPGTRSTAPTEPLEDDNDWESTGLGMPEGDASPTPKSPVSDIESSLLASGMVGDALASADLGGETSAGSGEESSSAHEESADQVPGEGEEVAPSAEDDLQSAQDVDPVLLYMLGVLKNDERALSEAMAFREARKQAYDKIRGLAEDEQKLREAMAKADAEAARQVGGAGLGISSLIGRMFKGINDPAAKVEGIGRKRRRAMEEYSGVQSALRNRLADYIRERYSSGVFATYSQSEAVVRSIHAYNQAFLEAEGVQSFREKVEAEAAATGRTPLQVMSDIGAGKGSDELKSALDEIREVALEDERVKKAAKVMAEEQDLFEQRFKETLENVDTLAVNGDPEVAEKHGKILEAFETLEENMPDPVTENEASEKFQERMAALRETIEAAMKALAARIMGGLGMKVS